MPPKSAKPQSKKVSAKAKRTSKKKSKGLGDSIEKITEATGIKKVVEVVLGDDCGCETRKTILNRAFNYHKTMTKDQCRVWESLEMPIKSKVLNKAKANEFMNLYNELHWIKKRLTNCPSCFPPIIKTLSDIYENTCQENKA